jgi:hypothetical protein
MSIWNLSIYFHREIVVNNKIYLLECGIFSNINGILLCSTVQFLSESMSTSYVHKTQIMSSV